MTGNYHDLSHHGQKKEKIEKLMMPTLLTASMGSANAHNFDDLPALVFDARMKTPGYWRHKDVPMSNLYLGLLQQFGAEQANFGESNGTFDLLA